MSRPRLVGLLLAFITLLVYLPAAHHTFVLYDDGDYVTENRVVQEGLTWAGIKWAFTTWHASNWHPLTWISHMADCQLFGLNPGGPHCVNVLFHAANTVLLFALLLRLANKIWPAAFVAALFAWHPLHVESVAWISERKDVLSTFFGLLALLSYARYTKENCRRSFWFALVFFALGLLAKPMLVTLPFVMLLLDYWPLQRFSIFNFQISTAKKLIFEKWPFFLLSATSCVVTFLAQRESAVVSLAGFPLDLRLANVVLSYGRYLAKAVWPVNLVIIYPLHSQFSWIELLVTMAALVVLSLLAWRERGRFPYLLVGWLWFLGTLVPVVGFVQVGNASMADRYTYFPLVGIFIAVAFGIRDLAKKIPVSNAMIATLAGLVLATCMALTEEQLSYWGNDESLFAHAAAVIKDNEVAHLNLGVAFERQGQFHEAMGEYRRAMQIDPKRVQNHNNVANLLDETGKTNEALAEYQLALKLDPQAEPAHDNFGTLLVKLGRLDEAQKQFDEAMKLDPKDAHPHYLTGKLLLRLGRDDEAIVEFRKAVQLDPDDIQVLAYLARVLASDENPQIRDGNAAFVMASKANALTDGIQPAILDTLAMAYAEVGRFNDAQQAVQDAISLANNYGLKDDATNMQQRLELYKNGQPCRQSFTNTTIHLPQMAIKFIY
ncbi:MAG TPA: tetratricopeptide repeat protein [Dongiaceae bacterium]|nr:tetratricopeptide repeat protein [Dongiaceae bacterium]